MEEEELLPPPPKKVSSKVVEEDFLLPPPPKKEKAVPSFSTDMSNTLSVMKDSPLQTNVDKVVKEPVVPAMPKAFSMPKEKAIVDKDPIGRTNLYKSTVDNITKRISNNLLIADELGKKGDGQGMQNVMSQINQDQKKIESLNKGIDAQRVIAEDMGYNTKGESLLRGVKSTLAYFLTAPEGYDESISGLEKSLYGMVGIDTGKMTKDIIEWKAKTEKELGKPIGVEEMRLSDDLAVIGRKILEQTGKEKQIANLGSKYGGDVIKLVKSGDVGEIVSQGVNSFLENAPTSLAFLNPYTAAGVVGGMMNEEITQAKSEGKEIGAQVVAAGAIKAALEFATENMMGGGKVVKDLVASLGKGAAEKVVKESIEKMVKEGFLKKYGKAISEEILGEVTNQIGSNAVDIYMNGKKDVKLSDGISDAAFAAIFSSGIQTAPVLLTQKYVDKKAIAASQEKKAQAAKLMESAVSQPTIAAQDAIEEKAHKLEAEANKEIDSHVETAKKATDEDLSKIDNLDTSIDEISASINENSDPEVIAILEDKKQELEKERTNTIKEIEKRPAPNTKFYQGVDFKAQTGLPNGEYTEEQVKAARENKLKKAGVTPAEIEVVNAEQEIIPATEAPAAPTSGVSGEVQESGDVTPITTNEQQNDKENGTGIQSNIGEGQEPVKTQPVETTGGEKIETGRNVQTYEKEIADLRAKEQAEYAALKNPTKEAKKKIYDKYDKLITPLLEASKAEPTEPSKSNKNYQDAQEANSIISKENPDASVLLQPKGEDLSLTAVYVGKEKRGKGIGSKVLESVKKQADRLGKKVVLDATNELDGKNDLERLGRFYERNGFTKVGENKYEYSPSKKETVEVAPKEGDTSATKSSRGMIQNMVFKDGEWQIKFGKDFTKVAKTAQQEAQDAFNEKNAPVAEVKEQAPVVENVPVEKTTSVYVAPFYDAMVKTTEEANDVEKSPAYKKYVQTINSVAEALGIKIKSIATNIGAYTNDDGVKVREVSTKVELETTNIDEATEFAVLMGALAPEVQESTIAAQGLSKEDVGTKKHTGNLIVVKVDNLEEAIAIAKEIGLDHTINLKENTIDFIAFNYFSKNAKELFKRNLGRFAIKIKEKGINYETKSKPIESRFIQSGADPKSDFGRKDVLERMAGLLERANGDNGSDMGLLGRRKMLRDALQEATRRNNEFIRQQELASERAEYGKLRAKQIELEKKGERLSDEEVKRFTELLNILIPSTQETVRNASEDYEEARKELEKVAAKVIGDLGFLSTFGIKRAERAATKILRWYQGKAQWLGDGARTNLIVYNEKDVMVLYKKLQVQYKGGIIRTEKDDTGLGYPKRLLEVRASNGKIAEFQVMTPEGYLAKDGVNGFPKEQMDFAAKELSKIQKRLGWLIPDGVGHYFYEIERDFNVPTDLRERAKAISLKYYDAFLNPDSKYTEKEFLDEISQFKEDVDAADKTNWDKGNNGISPIVVNDFIEDANNQYEPISVSDTSHETFTKDNAVDYEEGEREGDNGRSYAYLASVTVELIDDVSGDSIGTISKLKDEDGEITWNAEDTDGNEVIENAGSKNAAQQALVDNYNKQKAKEFNKEKAKAAKEKIKEAEKAKNKAQKIADKEQKALEKIKEKEARRKKLEDLARESGLDISEDGESPVFSVELNENLAEDQQEQVKILVEEAMSNPEFATSETINIEEGLPEKIPMQQIVVDENDTRPEAQMMSQLSIPLDFIFGKSIGIGMSDTLTTGERTVPVMDTKTGEISDKKVREEGGIGYPFKSLMDLINGTLVKGRNAMGWAGIDDKSATKMKNAAEIASKITGKELKAHYFKNLKLTAEQKKRLEEAIPDNKEYGIIVIYKMGNEGIKSNEAYAREAFRLIDVTLSETEKKDFFNKVKQRLVGKDSINWLEKSKYRSLIENANSFLELENVLHGADSKIPLLVKADILKSGLLSTGETESSESINPVGFLLKSKGITIESVAANIEEPIMNGITMGQPMLAIAIDPSAKSFNDVKRERHGNYPYGVEGFPIGLFQETAPFHNLSPELMDVFVKSATTQVQEIQNPKGEQTTIEMGKSGKEGLLVAYEKIGQGKAAKSVLIKNTEGKTEQEVWDKLKKIGYTPRISIFQNPDGTYSASEGSSVKKFLLLDKKGNPIVAKTAELLHDKLKKAGVKLDTEFKRTRFSIRISGSTFTTISKKLLLSIVRIYKTPRLTAQEKLVKHLGKAFPNITVELTASEYDKLQQGFIEKKLFTKNGKSYGFVKDGRVYLNPTYLNNNTPIHEFGHIWNAVAKNYRPELYKKGADLIKNTKYTQSIINSPSYQKIIKQLFGDKAIVKNSITGKFEINAKAENLEDINDYVIDEALARAIGDKGELFVNEVQKRRSFENWMNLLFNVVKQMAGFPSSNTKEFENLTVDQFVDAAVKELLGGKQISDITSDNLASLSKESAYAKFSITDKEKEFRKNALAQGYTNKEIDAILKKAKKPSVAPESKPTENESPTATEQAEFVPNAKDIKAFEKILGTTSGAIRNKSIAEAVKVNPKIQEIMDNFEDLKKQLMASVELTEDCSW